MLSAVLDTVQFHALKASTSQMLFAFFMHIFVCAQECVGGICVCVQECVGGHILFF